MSDRITGGSIAREKFDVIESVSSIGEMIDPKPLVQTGKNWTRWTGPLISIFVLAAVAYQLRAIDYKSVINLLPATFMFWLAFVAYYFAGPVSEWVIFRRLWRLPIRGFPALIRKLVSNEILLGYLGEVYFYAWARRNARIVAAPFGAIKDVTILSALTGNVFTLLMVIIAAPLFGALHLGMDSAAFAWSAIFILVTSGAALILRKRLFTLPKRELWFVAAVHSARIVATTLLAAVMWHLLLPGVALSWWLLLGTLRQLLSRLPFLPNKDIVFAGMAAFLVGSDQEIVAATTLMATLIVCAHLAIGALLGISELASESRQQ